MAIAERGRKRYTTAEYLALEDLAEEKSEYVHGIIRPRPGGTCSHSFVMTGLGCAVHQAQRESDYFVSMCDLKVGVRDVIYYPEVYIFARPLDYYEGNNTVITNPLLTAEVIAPKTEARDRGEKLHNYLSMPSLQAYLILSQSEPRIEVYLRGENGQWDYSEVLGLNNTLNISGLSISLAMSEIYDSIEFD